MLKFLFGSKTTVPDLSFLGADMHSHLLPGLDDGLQQMEDTLHFMRRLRQMGYRKLICTPHILSDMYPNSPETILPRLAQVRQAVADAGMDMEVEAAAEYMIDLEFENLIASGKPLLSFGSRNYILIEMSYVAASPNVEKVIFELQMRNLKPVFAHPERYTYYHGRFKEYERLAELGCLLQVNMLSLSGYYGKEVKRMGELLFKKNMVQFLGTDMHHQRHLQMLQQLVVKKEFISMAANAELLNNTL
ncbi:MAG TPA: CpsB/CapC family capsule biosynthesis tyrosine phosphatase [Chitinophagaceae bacterium]